MVLGIQFLNELTHFEVQIGGCLCLYRSIKQSQDIFQAFAGNFWISHPFGLLFLVFSMQKPPLGTILI